MGWAAPALPVRAGVDALLCLTPSLLFLSRQVCYLRVGEQWLRLSDRAVCEVDAAAALGAEAFLLMYDRGSSDA